MANEGDALVYFHECYASLVQLVYHELRETEWIRVRHILGLKGWGNLDTYSVTTKDFY